MFMICKVLGSVLIVLSMIYLVCFKLLASYITFMYLDENEVRYLQVKCSLCKSDEEFEDFKKNHIIYDRATKRGANRMIWRKDGCFTNEFQKGFFDTSFLLIHQCTDNKWQLFFPACLRMFSFRNHTAA